MDTSIKLAIEELAELTTNREIGEYTEDNATEWNAFKSGFLQGMEKMYNVLRKK